MITNFELSGVESLRHSADCTEQIWHGKVASSVMYTMFMLRIILLQGGLPRTCHDVSYVALPAPEIRIRTSGELSSIP